MPSMPLSAHSETSSLAGNPLFQPWNQEAWQGELKNLMQSSYNKFSQALRSCVTGATLRAQSIATAAQLNMLNNMSVVKTIRQDVTEADLHEFFDEVKIFEFEICILTKGLAAMDGSRIYINRKHLIQEGDPMAQRPMENAYAHSLSLWNKHDPFHIASCHNPNLRSKRSPDIKVEAGDFYEECVYCTVRDAPSPFRINGAFGIRTV